MIPPLDGIIRVTDVFGTARGTYSHGGIDLGLTNDYVHRKPIRSPEAAEVVAIFDGGYPYGNAVAIKGASGVWRFMHMDEPPPVAVGQTVPAGGVLGLVGSTGNSTGPHLHMDVAPEGEIHDFKISGERVDPLKLYADAYATAVGYDSEVFRSQIAMESGWDPNISSFADAEGVAQIIPRWHPTMRGKTFDPFASLDYAANLMAAHIAFRDGDYREALADYNTGRNSSGDFRNEGYHYAEIILRGKDVMATTSELELLRADRDRNHAQKLGALHHLGITIELLNRIDPSAFASDEDRAAHDDAQKYYHDPK
jgi:hypothetical protein